MAPARTRTRSVDQRQFLAALVAVSVALRTAPESLARLAGGWPLVLVTADLESRVRAVELSSGKVVRSIPTLPDPRSIESVGGRIARSAPRWSAST